MPYLGHLHPLVVHFAIALSLAGVLFRVLSVPLRKRYAWLAPAASSLLIVSAIAAAVSAKSGREAHGRAEHVPGCAPAVFEHEEWGERARNVLLAVAALELASVFLRARKKDDHIPMVLSAALGLGAAFMIFKAGKSGGDLVYSFAGGVGVRGSDPADTGRLLVAGYYHRAEALRDDKRPSEANALLEQMGETFPTDAEVQLVVAESRIKDVKQPERALEKLETIGDAPEIVGVRRAILRSDALGALGKKAEARAALEDAMKKFPAREAMIRRRLDADKP